MSVKKDKVRIKLIEHFVPDNIMFFLITKKREKILFKENRKKDIKNFEKKNKYILLTVWTDVANKINV